MCTCVILLPNNVLCTPLSRLTGVIAQVIKSLMISLLGRALLALAHDSHSFSVFVSLSHIHLTSSVFQQFKRKAHPPSFSHNLSL